MWNERKMLSAYPKFVEIEPEIAAKARMAHYFSDIIHRGGTKDSVYRSVTAGNKMELSDMDGS